MRYSNGIVPDRAMRLGLEVERFRWIWEEPQQPTPCDLVDQQCDSVGKEDSILWEQLPHVVLRIGGTVCEKRWIRVTQRNTGVALMPRKQ